MNALRLAWLMIGACILSTCQSLATPSMSPSSTTTVSADSLSCIVDKKRLVETIRSGRVYQDVNFLTAAEIQWLSQDMERLQAAGSFERSGLSDTSRGSKQQQGFGVQDRSVSAVPWWLDALQGNFDEDNIVAPRLQELRHALAAVLDRPTMSQNELAHECYYSISGPGSFLPRHMDEKHEDLKGSKGWLLPSRRSLSWLIYLSDENWTLERNGGGLRSFPPRKLALAPREPTHEGNLQIAWLHRSNGLGFLPVYMDSWFRHGTLRAPHAILYTVTAKNERQVLTQPWLNDNLPPNLLPMDFLQQMATHDASTASKPVLFLQPNDARDFHLIEDRHIWDQGRNPTASEIQDIAPLRGSLVIFDSVLLPHQVEEVLKGQRIAAAGWFHERTQEFPADFYGDEL